MTLRLLDQAIAMLQRRGRVSRIVPSSASFSSMTRTSRISSLKSSRCARRGSGPHDAGLDGRPPAPQRLSHLSSTPLLISRNPISCTRVPAPDVQQAPEAERRQLTVLFCDLVDSTPSPVQLDPGRPAEGGAGCT